MDVIKKWKKERLKSLRNEAVRLIERIDDASTEDELGLWTSKKFAAVKRASLDLNAEGVRLRKGINNDNRDRS